MIRARVVCAVLAVGVLAACSAPQVGYDYDTTAPFPAYHTYDWLQPIQESSGDKRVDNTLVDGRIRAAVEAQLQAKGYRIFTGETPDFYVAYHAGVKDLMKGASTQHYIGDRAHGIYTTTSDIQPYKEGMLLVDIVDASTKQLVWRGYAQAEVPADASPQERDRRIRRILEEMFSHFPPHP